MVKVYFTYTFDKVIGQAISKNCNFIYEPNNKVFICGVNQYISIISAKTGEATQYLYKEGKNVPVRHIYVQGGKIYAGYEDGELLVWSLGTGEQLFSFDLHKSTISSIVICEEESKLISAGFDGNIMIWDLLSQECQAIKSAHPSMITQVLTASVLVKGKPTQVILSVGKDGFFRVWDLKTCLCITALSCQVTQVYSMVYDPLKSIVYIGTNKEQIVTIEFTESQDLKSLCRIRGVFKKKSFARCMDIFMEHSTLYIFNADKTIEIYKILAGKQLEARKKRLINRKKKGQEEAVQEPEETEVQLKLAEQKVVPFKFYNGFVYEAKIYLNNGTNVYQLGADTELTEGIGRTQQICLEYPFAVQRNPSSLNVYSSSTSSKLFSIPVKAQWCHLFSSGHILIVQAESIQIWNLLKNEEIYRLKEKWSGCWAKKNRCLLWRQNQLGIYQIGYDKSKNIKMKLMETKRFQDKITQASFKNSMDKYIVNLQNNQILINYSDTHKNFLKLYGHKLPILSFDIASDDSMIATGSVDKDIRVWDMDFGHSIKSIFAHQQAVTVVKFVPETHYLFSGSKDGHIKFWDMDTYQLIMDFDQSTMEIKSLAVSQSGDMIMAGGLDEGFRIWKQTNDQTIATDMEEKQLEKVMIEDYTKQKLDQKEEKTRYEDLKHGQQIIEALENKETPKTIMKLIKKIPAGNLKSCLSFLHDRHIRRLNEYIKYMIAGGYEQETCWRVVRELNRGTQLGKTMRDIWKPVEKMVQLNTEILRTVLKQIQEQNQLK